jgi:hypothetical protein
MDKSENLIPITFGVSGHRHIPIQDQDRAKACIIESIKFFRKQYPDTPFIFLSSLAQGADIIAAEAAIEADPTTLLYTVFPYSLNSYKETISPEWLPRFEALHIQQAGTKFISLGERGDPKINEWYLEAGEFIALHAHVFFVIRNQETSSHGKGGTMDIVDFRNNGCANTRIVRRANLNCAEEGLMYTIHVNRSDDVAQKNFSSKDDLVNITPKSYEDLTKNQEKSDSKAIMRIGKRPMNIQELLFFSKINKYSEYEINNLNRLIKQSDHNQTINLSKDSISYLKSIHDVCSEKSVLLKNKFKHFFLLMVGSISLYAGFEVLLHKNYIPHSLNWIGYFFSVTAFLFFAILFVERYKSRFESTRGIAEAIKIQKFWFEVGLNESVADYYIDEDFSKNSWIRRAIRSITLFSQIDSLNIHSKKDDRLQCYERVKKEWIGGQIQWLTNEINKYDKNFKETASLIKKITIYFPFLALILIGIGSYWQGISVVLILMLLFFLFAKAMNKYLDFVHSELTIERYQALRFFYKQLSRIYDSTIEKINNSNVGIDDAPNKENLKNIENIFRLMGIAALHENGEWYLQNSREIVEHPVESP